MLSVTRLTASCDIMLGVANGIRDQLGVVASGVGSTSAGLRRLDLRLDGASVSMGDSMPGLLFRVWRACVLGAAKRSFLFIGLVDEVTNDSVATL